MIASCDWRLHTEKEVGSAFLLVSSFSPTISSSLCPIVFPLKKKDDKKKLGYYM